MSSFITMTCSSKLQLYYGTAEEKLQSRENSNTTHTEQAMQHQTITSTTPALWQPIALRALELGPPDSHSLICLPRKNPHVLLCMPEAILNQLRSCSLLESALEHHIQFKSGFHMERFSQEFKFAFDSGKHGLDGELYAVWHFGGSGNVVDLLINGDMSWLSERDVSAVFNVSPLWLPAVYLGPPVLHCVPGVRVERHQKHRVATVVGILLHRPAEVGVLLEAEPFRSVARMEVPACQVPHNGQGFEPEPFLELSAHKPCRTCACTALHSTHLINNSVQVINRDGRSRRPPSGQWLITT